MIRSDYFNPFKVISMSVYLSDEEERRLNAYVARQDYFSGIAKDVAYRMLVNWIAANLPALLSRIRQAMIDGWDALRDWLGI